MQSVGVLFGCACSLCGVETSFVLWFKLRLVQWVCTSGALARVASYKLFISTFTRCHRALRCARGNTQEQSHVVVPALCELPCEHIVISILRC